MRTIPAVALLVALLGHAAVSQVAGANTSNSLMDVSADGRTLACAVRDGGTLGIVDLETGKRSYLVDVGKHPEGITFVGESNLIAVAVYDEDAIVLVDAVTGEITGRVEVFDEPYSVVSNADGSRLYATLSYPGQVVEIDPAAKRVTRSLDVGPFARGLALTADGDRLYVTEYYSSMIRAVDVAEWKVVDEWPGASTDNLTRQITLNPRRPKAYLPHIRSRITAVHGEGSIFPYVSVADTRPADGKRRTRIPMDAFIGARVTANPWEVAVTPDGRQLFVVFAGTNDLYACDVLDDDYRELSYRGTLALGNNPRAVRVHPNGKTFLVYNALDFEVVEYDVKSLRRTRSMTICENPLSEEMHRGKVLFYSALQPMVGRRWISCSSCHPDGESDGRTWHNPEGLRNTQSLAGMAWTHPIHWSADRDEVQDFEHTIRGKLMQGRGLLRGRLNDSLAEPNKGLSAELDAMAVYSNSHEITLSPHAKNGLSEAAERGRRLFLAEKTGCAKCHSGPWYTDSSPVGEIVRHDVGTGDDDPSELMGPAYDTPTLLGIYRTAPYLHHGRARTLREVLVEQNPDDRHGTTSQLTEREVDDLVEFLKALPYEDPEPAARKARLVKVER